ncbi:MacB family efflux pump subunit [Hyphococcus flavus]|uniref:MacB family efflux pump subunit n=1 Tax=Hyphococcus flavus TaxID=1866326 RepID=A0AAE9ZCQ7_9PROT|nr:MacB family efflux pump subunit [Hyphococcus flavus]WDI30183.1 MacB family efflux pump subunit [Hyphococcus flavus]
MSALLELQNAERVYGDGETQVRALDGVSLSINAGEFVAIVGQSGSGKSTLMNILGCLDKPTGGAYNIRGHNISDLDADDFAALRRDTFGFVFQRYNLLANATALENVEIPAIYAGVDREARELRAGELLAKLGVGDRSTHRPNELSGGQQQRVSIARALMNDAEVILADEPTGALDSSSSGDLLELLEELHAAGRTIILITHDTSVAARAKRIIEIKDGKIVSDTGAARTQEAREQYQKQQSAPTIIDQIGEAVKMAFRSLRANLFRTSLTMLGVIIGVSAVVAMLAIGEGSQKQVVASIETMGSNLLFVRPGAPGTRMRGSAIATLTTADAEAIAELDNVVAAVPVRSGRETLRAGALDYQTTVDGVSADWPLAQNWKMAEGTFFSAEDQIAYHAVVVLGATVANNLFPDGNAIGNYVFIGGAPFEIAGILAPKGATAWGQDMDDVVLVPITTGMMRLFGQNYLSSITIAVDDTKRIAETETSAHALVLSRHGTEDFQIRNTASLLESVEETQSTFAMLLGSIAAISLLVGGIGVMNIMLVNVSERTREIGVRMATGARRSDIMVQFNTEALVVGGLGGLIGLALGLAISLTLERFGMSISITPEPAILAFGSALAIGLIFGYLPARKAARLDPVIALASE